MDQVSISTLANGAVEERFNRALANVLENIQDPNTDYNKKRAITVKVTFVPNEQRDLAQVDFEVKETLVSAKTVKTALMIGTDGTGQPVAAEYVKQIPGQIFVNEETGEIVDFQKRTATK